MNGLELVERYGIVLQSARGPIVNLPELVVGRPISGSWWGHPQHDDMGRHLSVAAALVSAGEAAGIYS